MKIILYIEQRILRVNYILHNTCRILRTMSYVKLCFWFVAQILYILFMHVLIKRNKL